jgi:hypothetical protein
MAFINPHVRISNYTLLLQGRFIRLSSIAGRQLEHSISKTFPVFIYLREIQIHVHTGFAYSSLYLEHVVARELIKGAPDVAGNLPRCQSYSLPIPHDLA